MALYVSIMLVIGVVAIIVDRKTNLAPLPVHIHALFVALLWGAFYFITR